MDRIAEWIKRNRIILLGVLIILITHILSMLLNNSGPLGEYVYEGGDNQKQLLGIVAEMRRKILEGESPFYSWRLLGGMDFYLPFTSGISNPFTLILCFFPYRLFNDVSDVLVVLSSIAMFLSISYYLINRESGRTIESDSIEILIFGLPYALLPEFFNLASAGTLIIAYILMPLVILGLEKIVYNKGWKLYLISLSMMMITITYLGFVGCIFIVLYYITLDYKGVKHFFNTSLKTLVLSLLAVLTSAFYFVPQFVASSGDGYGFSEYQGVGFYVNWLKIIDEVMWGTPLINGGGGITNYWKCNLYVGMLITLLALSYFFIKRIRLNVRFRKLVVLIILVMAMNESTCNYIMHLFHYTHGHPNRHSIFMFFYLIVLAVDAYCHYSGVVKKNDKIRFVIMTVLCVSLFIVSWIYNGYNHAMSYFLSVVLILVYAVAILVKKRIKTRLWLKIVCSVLVVEICTNFLVVQVVVDEDRFSNTVSDSIESSVELIGNQKAYRSGYNTWFRDDNCGLVFGYNTNSGYSNSANINYVSMLRKLGVDTNDTSVYERGYNSFLNAVFARRYLFESQVSAGGVSKDDKPFINSNATRIGDVILYDNRECIEPIVVAEGDLGEFDSLDDENSKHDDCIVVYNNALCKSLTKVDGLMEQKSVEYNLIKATDNCEVSINGERLGVKKHDVNSQNISVVEVTCVIPEDGEYIVSDFDNYNIGYKKAGEEITCYVDFPEDCYNEKGVAEIDLKLNRINLDKWKKAYGILKSNQAEISKMNAGYIEAEVTSDGDRRVFTTIPYSDAWDITVDGVSIKTADVAGSFLAFDLDKGNHKVIMKYSPKGVVAGIIVSVISIVIGIALIIIGFIVEKRKTGSR